MMALFNSDTLKSPLFPTFFFYRILGMGLIDYPVGRPRRILGLIFSSMISIAYAFILFVSYNIVSRISKHVDSSTAKFAFCALPFVNFVMIIANFVNYTIHSKEHNHCITELMNINSVTQTMRATRSYESSLMQRTWQLIGSLLIFSIGSLFDYIHIAALNIIGAGGEIIFFWCMFVYPVFVSTFGNIAFYTFNRVMTQSFEDLNSLLESMRVKHPGDYNTKMGYLIQVDAILEDKKKLEKLRRIRKIYSRLANLAKRWTELNGLHVLSSTILSIWIGTIEAFNLYRRASQTFNLQLGLAYARSLQWIIYQIVKLYIIVWPTATMVSKARRTGGILLRHLQPIAFLRLEVSVPVQFDYQLINSNTFKDEFQKLSQVNEFALQLIQNPLRLSAGGLLDLDYSLIQMVVTSVATYLVVLVQTHGI